MKEKLLTAGRVALKVGKYGLLAAALGVTGGLIFGGVALYRKFKS